MPSNPISILIVDDITMNREILRQDLVSLLPNNLIAEADNGNTAVSLVHQRINNTGENFEIIFMDYLMPNLKGDAATNCIRQLEAERQVNKQSIIITWSSAKSAPFFAADDWLPKPSSLIQLKALLDAHGYYRVE